MACVKLGTVCLCVSLKLRVVKYICRISFLTTSSFPVPNTFYVSDIRISTQSVAHYKKQTHSSCSNRSSQFRVFVEDEIQLSPSKEDSWKYINYPLFCGRFQFFLSSISSSHNSSSPVSYIYSFSICIVTFIVQTASATKSASNSIGTGDRSWYKAAGV